MHICFFYYIAFFFLFYTFSFSFDVFVLDWFVFACILLIANFNTPPAAPGFAAAPLLRLRSSQTLPGERVPGPAWPPYSREGAFPPRLPRSPSPGLSWGGGGALRALRDFAAFPRETASCSEAPPRLGRAGAAPTPELSRLNPPRQPRANERSGRNSGRADGGPVAAAAAGLPGRGGVGHR